MRALGYCRVSSLEQATGTSLRDQQAAIEAHAKARGVALAHVYVEAESGIHESNEKREQMQALLRDVKRGDLVLCDKLDRWSEEPSSPRPVADVAGARAKLARRRARYLELAAGDLMTDDELRAALLRVDDELRGLEEAPRDTRPRRERLAEVDTLARAWEAATGAERRAIVRELAVSVAVSRAGVTPLWRSPR